MAKSQPSTPAPADNGGTALAKIAGALAFENDRISDLAYSIVQMTKESSGGDVALAIKENFGTTQLSAFDFQRIKIPGGGGITWEIIDPESGDIDSTRAIEGIIVYWNDQKAYWPATGNGSNSKSPPSCYSLDTKQGIGQPGIQCARCPHNKFGSSVKPDGGAGRGKACKDSRLIFVVGEKDLMPKLIVAPPTSLKLVKDYFMNLSGRAIPYWQAISSFSLVKDRNPEGKEYSKVQPKFVAALTGEAMNAARSYGEVIRSMLKSAQVQVQHDEVNGEGTGGEPATDRPVDMAGRTHTGGGGDGAPEFEGEAVSATDAGSDDRSL